jgi:hypothetical protein
MKIMTWIILNISVAIITGLIHFTSTAYLPVATIILVFATGVYAGFYIGQIK